MKLSITMMVKDESKNLPKCLEAVKPVLNNVDSELIIMDTGSSDNTVNIAKGYTDKVYFHPWNNNFADMRNKSISYAKGEWIWILDADEVLEETNDIIKFFNEGIYMSYKTALIYIKSTLDEGDASNFSLTSMPRLFKRSEGFRYSGAIHEQPQKKPPFYKLNSTLRHYGYVNSDRKLIIGKAERNGRILEKELQKDPDNIYYLFHLSKCYFIKQDFKEALKLMVKAYEVAKAEGTLKNNSYIFSHLVECYFWNYKYSDAEIACKEGILLYDKNIDLYYILAKSQLKLRKYKESVATYIGYLNLVNNKNILQEIKNASIESAYMGFKDNAYADLIRIYWQELHYEKVMEYLDFFENISAEKEVFSQIIDSHIQLLKFKELKEYYIQFVSTNKECNEAFINCMESLLSGYEQQTVKKVVEMFSVGESDYSCLNKVRLKIYDENWAWEDKDLNQILKFDYNNIPYFFGDILYYALKCSVDLIELFKNVYEFRLKELSDYASNKYNDFSDCVFQMVINGSLKLDSNYVRINKVVISSTLLKNKLKEDDFLTLFKNYVFLGIEHMKNLYETSIIKNRRMLSLGSKEDIFLMYMLSANSHMNIDNVQCLHALRDAIVLSPELGRGIKLINSEIIEAEKTNNKEIKLFKAQVKNKIQALIADGELSVASTLISEYEKTNSSIDSDIISMKSIIAIMEDKLLDAEKILWVGLINFYESFDMFYNMAFLKEKRGKVQDAIVFYKKALSLCTDGDLIDEIKEKLAVLSRD